MATLEELESLVIKGKAKKVTAAVQELVDEGVSPSEALNTMIGAMGIVGEKFKNGEIFVPEMLVAAKSMKSGVEVLKPYLASGEVGALGTVIIGTVSGDMHDIGKNLVAMMIESKGFTVVDLGVDVPKEKFVEACIEHPEAKVVALSALLTTTMGAMEETVELLNSQEFRNRIKIMVGGAPVTKEFCERIGADAFTQDAASAAEKAKELIGA
ncbi:MAG: corrinoid protein [Oscillospiraceae bacterium]|nr:corrinoid protein [Oscillospiraceae bacterium]